MILILIYFTIKKTYIIIWLDHLQYLRDMK